MEERLKERKRTRKRSGRKGALCGNPLVWVLCAIVFLGSAALSYHYVAVYDSYGTTSEKALSGGSVKVLKDCNLRSAPGTASEVIGHGKTGERFEYAGRTDRTDEENEWFSIWFEDGTAWVSDAVAELEIDS